MLLKKLRIKSKLASRLRVWFIELRENTFNRDRCTRFPMTGAWRETRAEIELRFVSASLVSETRRRAKQSLSQVMYRQNSHSIYILGLSAIPKVTCSVYHGVTRHPDMGYVSSGTPFPPTMFIKEFILYSTVIEHVIFYLTIKKIVY